MPALDELQGLFARFLLSAPGTPPPPALLGALREQGGAAEQRLAVYKNNVYAQLIGALEDIYPAVRRLTGEEFFRYAARAYVVDHPPRAGSLLEFGEAFPLFLADFAPAGSVPYLPDVARLERAYLQSYHAPEALPLPKAAVAMLLCERTKTARLRLHPSARLITSPFPVSRIWELNVRPSGAGSRRRIEGGREYLLIIRPRATVEVRRISRSACAALAAIDAGGGIGEALAAGRDPDADPVRQILSLAAGETFCSCEKDT